MSKGYKKKIQWNHSFACNFNCEYCFIPFNLRKDYSQNKKSPLGALETFNNLENSYLVVLGGGEPFFNPGFIPLCKELIKKHYLVIVTNLSCSLNKFCLEVDPERVNGLSISLHMEERERLGIVPGFIEKIHTLKEAGYPFEITQVMYPTILDRWDEIYHYFKREGIEIHPKTFEGKYNDIFYPKAYTDEDRKKINKYFKDTHTDKNDIKHSKEIMEGFDPDTGLTTFKGHPCCAGYDDFVVSEHGVVRRCWTESSEVVGNIYDGGFVAHSKPKPCDLDVCLCPQMGYDATSRAKEILSGNTDVIPL